MRMLGFCNWSYRRLLLFRGEQTGTIWRWPTSLERFANAFTRRSNAAVACALRVNQLKTALIFTHNYQINLCVLEADPLDQFQGIVKAISVPGSTAYYLLIKRNLPVAAGNRKVLSGFAENGVVIP